jgi:FtsP/CotA-like multicopper oxidase with cupredoxin domain
MSGIETQSAATFSSDISGLPECRPTEVVELADGDALDLRIAAVVNQVGEDSVRMLAYNRSIPGPTLKVRQGSEIVVHVVNEADTEATVHWHGLRLENRFDGVPHETQSPIPIGGDFTYRIQFPDPGLYWYHPHIREDYGMEMGLYGNILVVPTEIDYWPPAHRDVVLTLDDILIEDGKVAPFSRSESTHVAMGRFGNLLLIGGKTDLSLTARSGEVFRFYLTNTANTRVFNVALPGARMKLVGGDSGRVEREEWVEEVLLAPSERAVVDVLFDHPGELTFQHRTPDRTYPLASIAVTQDRAEPQLDEQFTVLRTDPELLAERQRIARYLDSPPDKTLAFVAEMDFDPPDTDAPFAYTCPMHPAVVTDKPGRCPECGMKLLASAAPVANSYTCPMHPEVVSDNPSRCPECGMKLLPSQLLHHPVTGPDTVPAPRLQGEGHDHPGSGHGHGADLGHEASAGIEWEDDMVEINKITTPDNLRWKLIDRTTDAENAAIDWRFTIGDQVKIRLVNEMDSDHPMHHPFHIHGAGRFLVLRRDGVVEPNLVWKDTVLVRTGQTVDILLDVSNPGLWMAHCHIAEHIQSGMMFSFNVDSQPRQAG